MFEKGIPPVSENPKEKSDALWNKLTNIPSTSGTLRKTLSTEQVRKFMEVMTSTRAVETDWLCMTGSLTPDQAEQYITASGDFDRCTNELTLLATQMADSLRPKLALMVKLESDGRRNEGLHNLFRSLHNLYDARFESLKGVSIPRNALLASGFLHQILALVGSDLIDMADDARTPASSAQAIRTFLHQYGAHIFEQTGITFGGIQFNNEKRAYKNTLNDPQNREILEQTIGFTTDHPSRDSDILEQENLDLLDAVRDEAIYKTIPLVTLSDENPQIIALRDDPINGKNYGRLLPVVRINFNSQKKIDFPGYKKDAQGQPYCDYGIHPGIVNFTISPETGDLGFITSGLPLSEIMTTDRYRTLQNYVLRKLKSYLDSKTPDIEDLFVYSPTEVAVDKPETSVTTTLHQETHPIGDEDESTAQIESYDQQEQPTTPPATPSDEQSDLDSTETKLYLPKHMRALIMDRIRGARADDLLAALRRMLGKEVRIEGSHHFFRSERTGIALPVPRRSQRSSHEISLGLILDNLKTWRYTPMELAQELGVKIPEKLLKGSSLPNS